MTYIYKSSTVNLSKAGKNWDLTVEWEGKKRRFWINFPFPLLKVIAQKKEGDIKKTFTIEADNIQLLSSFIKKRKNNFGYDLALSMLYDLGNQLQTLERFYLGVPFFSLSDVVIVEKNDKVHFFYLNDEKTYNFSNDKEMTIDVPHKKSPFFSPEMSKKNKLPMKLNFKSGFYSLASMVSYCLLNKDITIDNKKELLAPIYTSSLYWALLRMLELKPENRFYIII